MRSGPRRTVVLALLLGLFVLCVYLFTGSSDLKHNGDTDLRYQTTQAIVEHRHLWVDHPWWLDTRMAVGEGHHLYAFYAPGQVVLMIPLYLAGKVAAHHLSLPYDTVTLYASRSLDLFLGALLAVVVFLFALSLGYTRRVATFLTLIFAFATAAWPDAQSALEQTQVDLFLLLAVFGIWRFLQSDLADRKWLALAGTAVGLALWTRYDAILYVLLLGAFIAVLRVRRHEIRPLFGDAMVYAACVAPWLAWVAIWNTVRFGSPIETGLHESTLGEPFLSGLLGLTASPGKGLLWYLPTVFLLPWAAPRFARAFPLLSILFALLIATPLLFYANILYWHGDPAWGPRYLYTGIPYLTLPLGELFCRWQFIRPPLRAVAVAVIAGSVLLQTAAVSVTQWRFWYRLEVMQQQSSNLDTWAGRPFRWGASHYHYYWNPRQSPILIQVDNVLQVTRLLAGDDRYRLTVRPDPFVSNPADNYPLNSFVFWWCDVRHPVLGQRTRYTLAGGLLLLATATLFLLLAQLRDPSVPEAEAAGSTLTPARAHESGG